MSGAAHWGIFYDTCNNPLMSLVQINSRIREYVGAQPPLRRGGVAILVTPCDGTIDERFRPSDREMIQLFNRLGHDPARLEDYEEEYLNRQDLIAKYRFSNGAHPLHPFPVFYENSFILDQASTIIFAGARDVEGSQLVGAHAVADLGGRVGHGDQGGGQGPVGDGDPAGGLPHPAALEGQRLTRGSRG